MRSRASAVIDEVGAFLHLHRRHRGHRLDALDIDFRQLLDKGQHRVQFALQIGNLGLIDRDPREMRDTANGGGIDGHIVGLWRQNQPAV